MTTVKRELNNVTITYDGYGFCYHLPSDFRKDVYAEWRQENKQSLKQTKAELKQEFASRSVSE